MGCGTATTPSPTPAAATPAASAAGSAGASAPAASGGVEGESLDDLYQQALAEGGKLVGHGDIGQENQDVFLPVFQERFPGITVELTAGSSVDVIARAIAEQRGGNVQQDIMIIGIEYIANAQEAGILEGWVPPEAEEYPAELRGDSWVAIEMQFLGGGYNTNLVTADKAPDDFEDFMDPMWREVGLVGFPDDWEMTPPLLQKYDGDAQKVIDLLEGIAANEPVFHDSHNQLTDLLVAGQAGGCFTCYTHHFYPPRKEPGTPIELFPDEAVGVPTGIAVLKDAPHPATAKLWTRWLTSEEGQQAYADSGLTSTHPNVEPGVPRPETAYYLKPEDFQATAPDGRPWQEVWEDIFGIR
jgi:iron(III) transport system substrate-binding protein